MSNFYCEDASARTSAKTILREEEERLSKQSQASLGHGQHVDIRPIPYRRVEPTYRFAAPLCAAKPAFQEPVPAARSSTKVLRPHSLLDRAFSKHASSLEHRASDELFCGRSVANIPDQ